MTTKRPNFIVVYCDDLGYGDLGCYGSGEMKTPHLDQLAGEGMRFTKWYSNSPVCSPSRASLLTGRYPARAGVSRILGGKRGTAGLPLGLPTLPKVLKSEGYRTALFGKWHLGASAEYGPNAHGFDEFYGFRAGCIDYYSHIFYWEQAGGVNPVHDLWHNEQEVWENGQYMTEVITKKAVEYIEAASEEEPFFLYTAYNAPHYPMHAPKQYIDRFPELSPDRRIMAAMIAAVDDGVGDIVAALKRKGIYEDTVIFFSSDNGPSTESRNWLDGTEDLYYGGSAGIFRGHKGSLFDGGVREPAILSYPSLIAAGQTRDEVCAMMDIFPTFLELAGCSPEAYDPNGTSLVPLLRGVEGDAAAGKARHAGGADTAEAKDASGTAAGADGAAEGAAGAGGTIERTVEADGAARSAESTAGTFGTDIADGANGTTGTDGGTDPIRDRLLFWEYGEQLAVREGKWKLVLNGKLDFSRTAIDAVHLSDVDADPGERTNLAEQYPDIVQRLEEAVRHWYGTLREETIHR